MKILAVATFAFPDHFGGAERVLSEVCARLAGRSHEVTLLTGRVGDTAAEELRDGVRVVRYAVDQGSPLRFYRSVWRGVRGALRAGVGADADVLSVHQMLSAVAALAPGGARTRARVASFYAPYELEFLARWREGRSEGSVPIAAALVARGLRVADRYMLSGAGRVLVLSRFSLGQVERLHAGAAGRARVAPAGVDLQRFRPAANRDEQRRAAEACGIDDDGTPILLTVRRLVPRMGLPDLLAAVARLKELGLHTRLAIAGDGPERAALVSAAGDLGILDRTMLLGRIPDERLPDLYRAADVFVLPTRSLEGYGMATAEALASGLPVVATDAGATGELLADVAGSRLVPAGDALAMADAIAVFVEDGAARAAAAAAARQHAETHLHWDRHLDAFEAAAREAGA